MDLEADVAEPALLSLDLQLLKYHQAVVCLRYVHGGRLEELVGELGGHGGNHGGALGGSQLPFCCHPVVSLLLSAVTSGHRSNAAQSGRSSSFNGNHSRGWMIFNSHKCLFLSIYGFSLMRSIFVVSSDRSSLCYDISK